MTGLARTTDFPLLRVQSNARKPCRSDSDLSDAWNPYFEFRPGGSSKITDADLFALADACPQPSPDYSVRIPTEWWPGHDSSDSNVFNSFYVWWGKANTWINGDGTSTTGFTCKGAYAFLG